MAHQHLFKRGEFTVHQHACTNNITYMYMYEVFWDIHESPKDHKKHKHCNTKNKKFPTSPNTHPYREIPGTFIKQKKNFAIIKIEKN